MTCVFEFLRKANLHFVKFVFRVPYFWFVINRTTVASRSRLRLESLQGRVGRSGLRRIDQVDECGRIRGLERRHQQVLSCKGEISFALPPKPGKNQG